MNPYQVHYMNKYPKGKVEANESSLRAYSSKGLLLVALVLANGVWLDVSKQQGAAHGHDLSPIPKQARVWKLNKEGHVIKDERHKERERELSKFLADDGETVQSMEVLAALKDENDAPLWQFDKAGEVQREPKALAAAAEAPKAKKKKAS